MGGGKEIVTPDCGKLVSASEDELAAALRGLVENRDERLRLGAAGPARAAELCVRCFIGVCDDWANGSVQTSLSLYFSWISKSVNGAAA